MLRAISQNILKSPKEKPLICQAQDGIFLGNIFQKVTNHCKAEKNIFKPKKFGFLCKMNFKKVGKVSQNWPKNPPGPISKLNVTSSPPPPSSKWAGRLFSPFETPGHHGAPFGPKKGHYYIIWTYTTTYCRTSCKEIHLNSVYRTLIFEVLVGKMRLIFANILVRYNPR